MNRIYQGKVTAVEIPDGKDEQGKPKWKKLDDGESALWQHHQLFQDAVNYYTLALAALAGGLKRDDPKARENEIKALDDKLESLVELAKKAKKSKDETAMADVAKQKQQAETDKDRLQHEEAVWQWCEQVSKAFEEGVERKGRQIQWEKETLARILKKLDPDFNAFNKFEACCEAILKLSKADPHKLAACLMAVIEDANTRDLNKVGVAQLRALCSSKTKAGDAVTEAIQIGKRIEAAKLIHSATTASIANTAAKVDFSAFCKTPPQADAAYHGKQALKKIIARFKALHEGDDDDPPPFPELSPTKRTLCRQWKLA